MYVVYGLIAVALVLGGAAIGGWVVYRSLTPRVVEVGEKWAGTERDLYPRHKRP